MPMSNEDIAAVFEEMADLLEIDGANPFRVRAYRNGADTLRSLGRDVGELAAADADLTRLRGIGEELAAKIQELLDSGRCAALEKLRQRVPASLEELLHLPGLGPKRVQTLYRTLGIEDLEALEAAARDGRVRELKGFGTKTEEAILDAIAAHHGKERRFLRDLAMTRAEALVAFLRAVPGVEEVVVAGSHRRGRETVGDLDILVTAAADSPVMERFAGYERVTQVLSGGTTRSTVVLDGGLQVDLRVVEQRSLGAALHYFTGSRAHNIQIRRLGQARGLKINEYGVFKGEERVAGDTEASVFEAVGLPWIPPELREDRGEIEAAREGRLPDLITLKDLRGDLHCHTRATDGRGTLEEMAAAARERGLEYLAITDHSRRLTMVRGLDVERLLQQVEALDRLNETLEGVTLLKGIEVDILEDGSLDLPDEALGRLDLVVASVHVGLGLSRAKQTERVLRAMDSRHFSILAHPSGRLLEQRGPMELDLERVIDKARERGCFLELNAQPKRLDLDDVHCRMAKAAGVLVALSSDAHSPVGLDNRRYGIEQARRGWLEKADVLTTRPLEELRRLLAPTIG